MTEPNQAQFESLNALADGELGRQEREALLERIALDDDLGRALCDIQRTKDFVRLAYPEVEVAPERAEPRQAGRWWQAAAAVLLFVAGTGTGMLLDRQVGTTEPFALSQVAPVPDKIVLYIGESDHGKFDRVLDEAESYLKTHATAGAEVNIVTSAGGIDMLRTGVTPVAQRISALAAEYGALNFIACNTTISRLRDKGEDVGLVREAKVAPSAVQFVVGRLQEGWGYLAI